MIEKIKNYFYYLCEHYGGYLSCWAWHKRWNKKNTKWYQQKKTPSEKMQDELETIDED